jgi:hypothetical protein
MVAMPKIVLAEALPDILLPGTGGANIVLAAGNDASTVHVSVK